MGDFCGKCGTLKVKGKCLKCNGLRENRKRKNELSETLEKKVGIEDRISSDFRTNPRTAEMLRRHRIPFEKVPDNYLAATGTFMPGRLSLGHDEVADVLVHPYLLINNKIKYYYGKEGRGYSIRRDMILSIKIGEEKGIYFVRFNEKDRHEIEDLRIKYSNASMPRPANLLANFVLAPSDFGLESAKIVV